VLTVPVDTLMRVSSNPFFSYLAARTTQFCQLPSAFWRHRRHWGGAGLV